MSDFLLATDDLREAVKQQGKAFSPTEVQAFRTLFNSIVREGEADIPGMASDETARGRQSTAAKLLRRFRLHADAVLRFVSDFRVPFTNNEAERAVRMPKVKQKISGCFRRFEGAQHFCLIRSVLDTLRKQGRGMLTVLQRAFAGDPMPLAA
jgi:transposase